MASDKSDEENTNIPPLGQPSPPSSGGEDERKPKALSRTTKTTRASAKVQAAVDAARARMAAAGNRVPAAVATKSRSKSGGSKFGQPELNALLNAVNVILPISHYDWEKLGAGHLEKFPEEQRTTLSLKRKFSRLSKSRIKTGDPDCPAEVTKAKHLQYLLEIKSDAADSMGEDEELGFDADDSGDQDEEKLNNQNELLNLVAEARHPDLLNRSRLFVSPNGGGGRMVGIS